ncbi:Methyltransferase domain-containing protein [Cyclobacterium lianum]|uniref:Methyltransferase domain-containing protein n=1 Tax=Cyclobacterium lianum TaxID=388280 RepID=A0A1M7LHK6_9BACT|nr:class I SAM-dependent methyltransferase [Cyclobacterium lianum]SHM77506.1 Methyltransferase domain-containing protein [Cyclobacterium lianum]
MNKLAENWLYQEYQQTGKDYASLDEVTVYDPVHDDFRNIDAEYKLIEEWLEPDKSCTWADIGCGTGNFSVYFAKKCDKLYAFDISETMLEFAKQKARSQLLSNVEFQQVGYLNMNLPDSSLDAVMSSLSLHHLPDYWKAKALENIYRTLRPGGRLYIYDVVIPDEQGDAAIQAFIESQAERGGDFLREDTLIHFREEYSTFDWIMKGLIARQGFTLSREVTEDGVLKRYLCQK